VHAAERDLASPIVDLEEQRAAGFRDIDRFQDRHVGRELDHAARVGRRLVEIEDDRVVGVLRVDLEVRGSREPLVWAGVAERLALRHHLALLDLQADQASVRRYAQPKSEGEAQQR
jgi:hypothetical protein